jgi:hypothetical protein
MSMIGGLGRQDTGNIPGRTVAQKLFITDFVKYCIDVANVGIR